MAQEDLLVGDPLNPLFHDRNSSQLTHGNSGFDGSVGLLLQGVVDGLTIPLQHRRHTPATPRHGRERAAVPVRPAMGSKAGVNP